DEENGQNVPHPVKTEALASLVADDVADLSWNRRPRIGSNARGKENFGLSRFFHHRERRQNAANAQPQSGLAIFDVLKVNEYVDRFWIFTCPRRQLRAATSCWQSRALLAPSLDEVNRRSTPSSVQMQNPSLEDSTM
ncbi:MAG TPA: hypothetical protein VIJ87_21975, partial [Pyrinomonadaceae bacterium]